MRARIGRARLPMKRHRLAPRARIFRREADGAPSLNRARELCAVFEVLTGKDRLRFLDTHARELHAAEQLLTEH